MCVEIKMVCKCGKEEASIHFRDGILPPQAVEEILCPSCSGRSGFDPSRMLSDKGWVIVYDMELARHALSEKALLPPEELTPQLIFDRGWATWTETYPGEHLEIQREKEEILSLLKEDPKRYLQEIQAFAIRHAKRAKEAGWRKAQAF